MESPNKRLKQSLSEPASAEADFVSLSVEDDEAANQYGYGEENGYHEDSKPDTSAPRGPKAMYQQRHDRNVRNDPRHAKDKPKSKHVLPGYEPWILVRTKFGRRFVHNTETKESLWRISEDVFQGVKEFEMLEKDQKEKDANAKWAEDQLKQMRAEQARKEQKGAAKDESDGRNRRRRSESLQREDEAALMAELAAEAEHVEENDAKQAVKTVEPLQPKMVQDAEGGYGSDSSYEEVEVTDSEFEDDETDPRPAGVGDAGAATTQEDGGPMEFGEDDIAYQLAAMEQDYDNEEQYEEEGSQPDEYYEEDEEPDMTEDEAAATFRAMLDDHGVNPFTPWEKLIADESETGIIMDDRYTVLPSTRARKAVWESWVKDTAARLKEERAKAETLDPKVPYLAVLAERASPKLYWPEFKRKYRKESVLNDRKLSDKDREKLYRDHMNRLKLPEKTRKADLTALLKSIPLKDLNKTSTLETLPQQLLSNLHYISLAASTRDEIVSQHISSLPPAPEAEENGELTSEQANRSQKDRKKQDEALRAREKQVDEERKKAQQAERWAKRDLRDEERELKRAMEVGRGGLKGQLAE